MPPYLLKGCVRTLDPADTVNTKTIRCISIANKKILHIGDEAACLQALQEEVGEDKMAEVETVAVPEGGVVMPSFHDSHIHPCAGGLQVASSP